MNLTVISYKECWHDPDSPSGFSTVGGFPLQMAALSTLFDQTQLLIAPQETAIPAGTMPITGQHLSVSPLSPLRGKDWGRKLRFPGWLLRNLPHLWRMVRQADAVHALVPGDIGMIGILIAWLQRKPLFVRHCGTWGYRGTLANRVLMWLLRRIAGGKTVVMATGGGDELPEPSRPQIEWIFSTTLTEAELDRLQPCIPWKQPEVLQLVTVGRLTASKNTASLVRALPLIQQVVPGAKLHIVGDGHERRALQQLAVELQVDDAVLFHGNVSHAEVLQILAGGHIFVFPTRLAEGFPKSVLEAMACGLPIVAPRVSVIPHLLKDGCGILLDNTKPVTIAAAVQQLVADEARLAEMSVKAREMAYRYTLEAWQQTIAARLEQRWGPLATVKIE